MIFAFFFCFSHDIHLVEYFEFIILMIFYPHLLSDKRENDMEINSIHLAISWGGKNLKKLRYVKNCLILIRYGNNL